MKEINRELRKFFQGKESEVQLKSTWDVMDGWAGCSLVCQSEVLCYFDEERIQGNPYPGIHTDKLSKIIYKNDDFRGEIHGYIREAWQDYEVDKIEMQVEDIRENHGDEWVILHNDYERLAGEGFSNTFSVELAEKGQVSKYGWFEAIQIKDLNSAYDEELVALGFEKGWIWE